MKGSGRSWTKLTDLCDELCFEAFPYQILSPGHLARFERQPAGARPLAGGRIELSLGDPNEWLPESPLREEAVASARELLAPCLCNEDAVFRERLRQNMCARFLKR
jgi:hypothetical protein